MHVHNEPWQAAETDCTEVKDFEIGLGGVNNLFQDREGKAVEIREGAQAEWSMGKQHKCSIKNTLKSAKYITPG